MSIVNELRVMSEEYASKRITRRTLAKRAGALGLSATWIAALAKGATAAPAPTWNSGGRAQADRANTLIVAVEGDIDTFDPAFTAGSKTAQTVIQNTFDQLTQYQIVEKQAPDGIAYQTVDTEQIIPMLAETATVEGDTMKFTLRDGLTYSNGDPIDANVILQGYQRIFETKGISSFLLSMGGGVTDTSAFSAPDAKTFLIKMAKPNSLIPKNNVMHNTAALNPNEIAAHKSESDPWATSYFKSTLGIGNGPYKLDSYNPGDAITLVANESYYGEKPAFQTVVLKIVPDPVQRVQLLQQGDVDFASLVPVKEYDTLKADENIKVLSVPSNLLQLLEMNATIAPFDNVQLRQAVASVVPYQAIIEQIYRGQATPAGSIIPSGFPTSDFSTYPFSEDQAKAKELLAAAGYPDGKGLPEIKLSIRIGNEQWERIAILVADALSQIGVEVEIEKLAYAAFNEAEQAGQLQFWVDEFLAWVHDPFYQLSWTTVSTSPVNYPRFKSERVDELVTQYALAEAGPERDAASKEVQTIVNEACNYVYLCQPNFIVFTRADIDGYVYYNDELPRFHLLKRA